MRKTPAGPWLGPHHPHLQPALSIFRGAGPLAFPEDSLKPSAPLRRPPRVTAVSGFGKPRGIYSGCFAALHDEGDWLVCRVLPDAMHLYTEDRCPLVAPLLACRAIIFLSLCAEFDGIPKQNVPFSCKSRRFFSSGTASFDYPLRSTGRECDRPMSIFIGCSVDPDGPSGVRFEFKKFSGVLGCSYELA